MELIFSSSRNVMHAKLLFGDDRMVKNGHQIAIISMKINTFVGNNFD